MAERKFVMTLDRHAWSQAAGGEGDAWAAGRSDDMAPSIRTSEMTKAEAVIRVENVIAFSRPSAPGRDNQF
jgi:hypothetical protein